MRKKTIRLIIYLLLAAMILLSGRLAYADFVGAGSGYCILGPGAESCNAVQNSIYGSFLGVKVSYVGFVAFVVLGALYLGGRPHWRYRENSFELFLFAAALGSLFSLYLLIVQIFILGSICSTCVVIDVCMLVLCGFAFVEWKKRR